MKKIIIACLLLSGCAKGPLVAPSPGAIHGALARVDSNVSKAQSQQSQVSQQAAEAGRDLQRADDKDVLIQGYKKWKASHP